MLVHSRPALVALGCLALMSVRPGPAFAEDGPALYSQLCASCHEAGTDRAPDLVTLQAMSPERVLTSLESGTMLSMASGRTGVERRAIAEFVTGKAFSEPLATTPSPEAMCGPSESDFVAALDGPRWAGWGANTANTRFQETEMAGLTAADVPRLEVKWAFGFPGELSMDAQPTVTGGRVFLGTQSGAVYSLSAATGCVHWMFQAAVAVRAAISIGRVETQSGSRVAAFIGDRSANVYAVDAATGELLWTTTVDDFALARVTGSPTFHDGRLYVGVASGEESAGASADYECCTFRGSLLALDAVTGAQIWKTYTIEPARPMAKNRVGTQLWGPSGAPIWNSPAIDVQRNAVYVTTGNNYSGPATANSDAFMAFDMDSGRVLWAHQTTADDDWNTSCRLQDQINCTNLEAPDFDFASPPILVTLANGRRALVAGQKSGVVHAIDPDRDGELIWQARVGKGGINGGVQWGSAADASAVYVALSDLVRVPVPDSLATTPDPEGGGGMFALRLDTGERAWYTPPPAGTCEGRERCSPAQSAAVTGIPGVVFSGSVDGHLRAFSTASGDIVWDFDTVQTYDTVNGIAGRGGSLNVGGAAVSGGTLFVNSGYAQNGTPGNVLLAFSVDGN
ncbi:PQQ-binding-like beta-propeller repeat protein [Candidatus Rariloculus sp.]|uniref:outer membrane protein assembly factor BamB family protein n=1 Tax=Candidatus Rariloculus sp. TaxID=3101265 RepID=UPI003D143B97